MKPANVLLRKDGVTKLADLGIATAADHTRITRSGTVLGTAAYMAPEQLDGAEAGSPADVYALAAVCFEALSGGRRPDRPDGDGDRHRIATEPPPDLRERRPRRRAAAGWRRGWRPSGMPGKRRRGELGSVLRRALEGAPGGARERAPRALQRAAGSAPGLAARRRHAGHRLGLPGQLRLALAVAVVALLTGRGDDDERRRRRSPPSATGALSRRSERRAHPRPEADEPAPATEPSLAPAEPAPAGAGRPRRARSSEHRGFPLQQGRYDEAIRLLQRAGDLARAGNATSSTPTRLQPGQSLRCGPRGTRCCGIPFKAETAA